MKLKRIELVSLNHVLSKLSQNTQDSDKRFNYMVIKNLETFKVEIECIKKVQQDNPKFAEFQSKVQQVGIDCSDKDKDGNPILQTINNVQTYVINERKQEADKVIGDLKVEYKEAIDQRQTELEQINQLMEEDVEVEVVKCSWLYLPNSLNINDQKILKLIIKETDEEIEKSL